MPTRSFSLLDTEKVSMIVGRQSIFLDSNIWIDIAEARTAETAQAKSLLVHLVSRGIVFCPVSLAILFELFLQESDSALRQARLMDELSLSITYRQREEIWEEEIGALVESFLEDRLDVPQVQLDCTRVFAPALAHLGSRMNLEYPAEAPTTFVDEVTSKLESEIKNIKITRMVEMLGSSLPMNEWKDDYKPEIFSEIWRDRRAVTRGNRKRVREIEKQSIMNLELLPRLLKQAEQLSLMKRLTVLQRIAAYVSCLNTSAGEALLRKLPTMNQFVEILTVTGLNDARKSSSNDLIDIENMVVPTVYADVFVARDKWVRAMMSDSAVQATTRAKCLYSVTELVSYCESLHN